MTILPFLITSENPRKVISFFLGQNTDFIWYSDKNKLVIRVTSDFKMPIVLSKKKKNSFSKNFKLESKS